MARHTRRKKRDKRSNRRKAGAEESGKAEKVKKAEKPEKVKKVEKPEKVKKVENVEQVEKLEKAETSGGSEDSKKTNKKKQFRSVWTSIMPFGRDDKTSFELVKELFEPEELKILKYLLKSHKARFEEADFNTTHEFLPDSKYLSLKCNVLDGSVKEEVEKLNHRLVGCEKERVFESFSHNAEDEILGLIAPNIIGLDKVKRAGLYQLFAREKVHILLLGDPATGKTDVLRSVSELAPVSSYGLGSGSSKAGLTVVKQGKELIKGLLPMADQGIACIDELNLLRNTDRAGLLNAMEKGFVTYDKGDTHVRMDARINVFATANPEGDRFVGKSMSILKRQLPFDSALLSRFHLVFLIRKPDTQEFLKITDKIIKGEKTSVNNGNKRFVSEYVAYALKKEVEFDKNLSELIQGFVEDVKKEEDKFLVDISPRIVIGIMNMSKAAARMRLKSKVEREDVIKALKVFNTALHPLK